MDRKKWIAVALAAVIGVGGVGYFWGSKKEAPEAPKLAPMVKTMVIGESAKEGSSTSYSGSIKNRNETQLAFQLGGRVLAKHVNVGDHVEAGQLLASLNSSEVQDQIVRSQGSVEAAESQYRLAATNLERYRKLYAESAISQLQLDQAVNAAEVAQAQLNQARALLSTSETQYGHTELRAPGAGVITTFNMEVGQMIGAGQPVGSMAVGMDPEAIIALPEQEVGSLRIGDEVVVSIWALPKGTTKGIIREIAPVPDPVARTYTVKVSLPEPPEGLQLGMTAQVERKGATLQKAQVPLTALVKQDKGYAVFVVRNDTLHLVPVEVGPLGSNSVDIVKGLQKGDRIVTAGVNHLKEGEKVRL